MPLAKALPSTRQRRFCPTAAKRTRWCCGGMSGSSARMLPSVGCVMRASGWAGALARVVWRLAAAPGLRFWLAELMPFWSVALMWLALPATENKADEDCWMFCHFWPVALIWPAPPAIESSVNSACCVPCKNHSWRAASTVLAFATAWSVPKRTLARNTPAGGWGGRLGCLACR